MHFVLALIFTLFSINSFAAPKSELWDFWAKSNESNSNTISHESWQLLLDSYLVVQEQNTLFAYDKVSSTNKAVLKDYLGALSRIDPRDYNKAEQYAYWVNLYNALTVDLIIKNYPTKSITKLGGFFSFGPWGDKVTKVAGKSLTLNDIEHRILRPIWNDKRTHYAVNCASLGCPNLQTRAFTASNSEELLQSATNDFINSNKGALFAKGKLQLSSIYEWFITDFGTQQDLFEHLGQFREELKGYDGEIDYQYDWDLNLAGK